ncbi:phosphoribosyltransferase family protein [Caenimonas aquaedulcis]|uniref:Phosphoribosyltransferase domain-containing protein n=1 Tax=Caenimonas aquaedulcis TaxID=2793270 RepID=A0A931H7P9_9BURK|nr:phosphoribosyltransferase family protein [Caenimonas aquaedulcis]MBG9390224.1 hypothetical protein [Caenimonas aquaedulcis]
MFIDREDAATRLAVALAGHAGSRPVVLALTPGAAVIGRSLAASLGGELDTLCAPQRRAPDLAGRTVILLDEGMATGSPMRTALRAARAKCPAQLVCAVPVASAQALEFVKDFADEVVCLHKPVVFDSVRQWYRHFPPVALEEAEAAPRREILHLPADAAARAA